MAIKRNTKLKINNNPTSNTGNNHSKKKKENKILFKFPSVPKSYILILFIICVIIYSPSMNGDFFFDDEHFIVRNKYLTDWKYLPNILGGSVLESIGFKDNFYRPLSFVVYLVIYQIAGLKPFLYHLSSVIAHFLCGFIFLKLMMYICRNEIFSFLAVLIFICHPIETEAVAVACGLADPLSLYLLLIVVYYYIFLIETEKKFYIFLIFIFAALSFLAKERAGMAFLLIPVFDLAFIRKDEKLSDFFANKNRLFVYIGLLLLLLVYLQVRNMALKSGDAFNFYKTQNVYSENLSVRMFTFCNAFLHYLKFVFFPWPLHVERSIPVFLNFFEPPVIIGFSIMAVMFVMAVLSFYRRRIFFFCYFWFMIALGPSSGIIPINDMIMEHWIYFSMIGAAAAFSLTAKNIYENYKENLIKNNFQNKIKNLNVAFIVFFSILIITMCIVAMNQNKVWKNAISFFNNVLKNNPKSVKAHNNLAMALSDKNQIEQALYHYKKSIEISDEFPQQHHNLAKIYLQKKMIKEAVDEFNKAIEKDPNFVFSHQDLYSIYSYFGDKQRAAYHAQRIKEILGGR